MYPEGSAIGFLGEGQLALMLGESAERRGIPFVAYGKDPDSSFARRFPGPFRTSLTRECHSLALENEFSTSLELEAIESACGALILPRPHQYRNLEGKIQERRFYDSLGLPSPRWGLNPDEFCAPMVLKSSRGGYDGYGVRMVDSADQVAQNLELLGKSKGREILVEEKVRIRRELAQGALLDGKGGIIYLPLVESVQRNGICVLTSSRLTLPEQEVRKISTRAKSLLDRIAHAGIAGLFHFEFFYTDSGELLINECAPRPHNSAHLTLDACEWSQFDLLVEFLRRKGDLPLPSGTEIKAAPSVMVNLLGTSNGTDYNLALPPVPEGVESHPKLYLKKQNRIGRKMGHLNLVDRREKPLPAEELLALGEKILKEYRL